MRSKIIGLLFWVAATAWPQDSPPPGPPATSGVAAFTFFRPEGVPPTEPVMRPNGDRWRKTMDGWAKPGGQREDDEPFPVFWILRYHASFPAKEAHQFDYDALGFQTDD